MDKVHCPYCMGKDFMVPGSMDETLVPRRG